MKEQVEVRTLKEGRYMIVDDEPSRITSLTTSKPGKHGSAKARIEAVGIFTKNKRSVVFTVTDKVYVPIIDRRKAQVLNVTGESAQVMDAENYETFDIDVPDDLREKVQPGSEVGYLESMGRRMLTG